MNFFTFFYPLFFLPVRTDRDGVLTAAPRACYSTNFDLEYHDYVPEDVKARDYTKILGDYLRWNRPIVVLVTQREGRYASYGRRHLYLRMDYEGSKLAWSNARTDRYARCGHVFDDDLLVIHVHMQNTNFFVGAERNLLGLTFLSDLQKLLGLKSPLPCAAVILAGGSNDAHWFCSPSSPRGSDTDGRVKVTDTVTRFTDLVHARTKLLHAKFREYFKNLDLIVVGAG